MNRVKAVFSEKKHCIFKVLIRSAASNDLQFCDGRLSFGERNSPGRKEMLLWVIPQLWVQVIQLFPYSPLWQRGARGDFIGVILKSPFIPLCQWGIKIPETERLPPGVKELAKTNARC
jgi:hypothetical protein